MPDLRALSAANAARWVKARATGDATGIARRLVAPAARARYQAVATKTGVPWPLIAAIHEREASQDWGRSLAQGDSWDRRSVHVPAGRGPFASWEAAAVDALVNCPPYAARNADWSIGGALTLLERYNGLGYASRGLPSPYLWAGTDQYIAGKYVRDGVYDPRAVDAQPGCAALLMAMVAIDPTARWSGFAPAPTDRFESPPNPAPPSITHPTNGSIGAFLNHLLASLFKSERKKP